jgi:YggT family protein
VQNTLANFIYILGQVLWISILIRALMSWVMPGEGSGLSRILVDITEPILAPIRRILPPLGGLDLSPLVAIILINVLSNLLVHSLTSTA